MKGKTIEEADKLTKELLEDNGMILVSPYYLKGDKPKEVKSKKAFFSLAGKIDLDSDSVTEFREASLI